MRGYSTLPGTISANRDAGSVVVPTAQAERAISDDYNFDPKGTYAARAAQWENALRGYVTNRGLWAGRIDFVSPEIAEAVDVFPLVRVHLASGDVLLYSDLDRSIEGLGVVSGDLAYVSEIQERLAGGFHRKTCTIRLANTDSAKNAYLRSLTSTSAINRAIVTVGIWCSQLDAVTNAKIGSLGEFIVDRVESLTPTALEVSLIDRQYEELGVLVTPPTIGDIVDGCSYLHGELGTWNLDTGGVDRDERPKLALGRGMLTAMRVGTSMELLANAWGEDWPERLDVFLIRCAPTPASSPGDEAGAADGLSRRTVWDFFTGEDRGQVTLAGQITFGRLDRGTAASGQFRQDSQLRHGRLTYGGRIWYTTYLVPNPHSELAIGLGRNITASGNIRHSEDEFLCRPPTGAEGFSPAHGDATVAAVVGGVLGLTMREPVSRRSLMWAADSGIYEVLRALPTEEVALEVEGGTPVVDVLRKIGDSFGVDFYFHRAPSTDRSIVDGTLSSRIGMLAQSTAPTLKQQEDAVAYEFFYDFAEDSYSEQIPRGDDRWGWANSFRIRGHKPYCGPKMIPERLVLDAALFDDGIADKNYVEEHGQILEREVSIEARHALRYWRPGASFGTWYTQPHDYRRRLYQWVAESLRLRAIVRVTLPAYAVRHRLGDFVRITHPQGMLASGGYYKRLFRIDAVRYAPQEATVTWELVDFDAYDTMRPTAEDDQGTLVRGVAYVLDDENNSIRFKANTWNPGATARWTTGSTSILTDGTWDPTAHGVAVGDIFKPDAEFIANTNNRVSKKIVGSITSAGFTVESAMGTGETIDDFDVWRSYATPPDSTSHPGQYPSGTDANQRYGALCTEETGGLGHMSDNDDGYRTIDGAS